MLFDAIGSLYKSSTVIPREDASFASLAPWNSNSVSGEMRFFPAKDLIVGAANSPLSAMLFWFISITPPVEVIPHSELNLAVATPDASVVVVMLAQSCVKVAPMI